MKKIVLILNHVQAGFGSDENSTMPPGGKNAIIGPGQILNPLFKEHDAEIVATLYCGDQYYLENSQEVNKKFIGFVKKNGIDAVLCGPAMHYPKFGEMAARLAAAFQKYDVPAVAAMSIENPAVAQFRDQICIVEMPKKGGIGLNDSFKHMALITAKKAHNQSIDEFKKYVF
ncbi:GrdB-related putative oxidoreductase [Enterococcus mediterraneensis]|uniref:GrdB-related putative oxidoreductase n=1 Tax=Enterococcus mediterraneensis TaxID=2364791 RepID=UPI000F05A5C8|nr:GrdB-related putative oxidoreductase [Enterococcus mediterraneensis]